MTNKEQEINELFTRGVSEFIDPEGRFKEKLLAKARGEYNKDIIVKFGIDPTRPDIHLGHTVSLKKLRKLQDFGCKVVFLVGDFTAQIGDPTGKDKTRPNIDPQQVEESVASYISQIEKLLTVQKDPQTQKISDSQEFSWIRNSQWFLGVTDLKGGDQKVKLETPQGVIEADTNSFLGKAILFENLNMQKSFLKKRETHVITLWHLLRYLKQVTYSRLIERDMFQDRINKGEALHMHELMYPILQGVDSSIMAKIYGSCDLEVGGSDQTFNMLIGRDIMTNEKQEPQAVLATEILEGTDGAQKMSKSLNNYIAITDTPEDVFGKIMSVRDELIIKYFRLCTFTPLETIEGYEKEISSGKNPKNYKEKLAYEIVAMYHGEDAAQKAQKYFTEAFSGRGIPEDVKTIEVEGGVLVSDILKQENVVPSQSEFSRKVQEGAVRFINSHGEEKVIEDTKETLQENGTLRLGKQILGIKIKTP